MKMILKSLKIQSKLALIKSNVALKCTLKNPANYLFLLHDLSHYVFILQGVFERKILFPWEIERKKIECKFFKNRYVIITFVFYF